MVTLFTMEFEPTPSATTNCGGLWPQSKGSSHWATPKHGQLRDGGRVPRINILIVIICKQKPQMYIRV